MATSTNVEQFFQFLVADVPVGQVVDINRSDAPWTIGLEVAFAQSVGPFLNLLLQRTPFGRLEILVISD